MIAKTQLNVDANRTAAKFVPLKSFSCNVEVNLSRKTLIPISKSHIQTVERRCRPHIIDSSHRQTHHTSPHTSTQCSPIAEQVQAHQQQAVQRVVALLLRRLRVAFDSRIRFVDVVREIKRDTEKALLLFNLNRKKKKLPHNEPDSKKIRQPSVTKNPSM